MIYIFASAFCLLRNNNLEMNISRIKQNALRAHRSHLLVRKMGLLYFLKVAANNLQIPKGANEATRLLALSVNLIVNCKIIYCVRSSFVFDCGGRRLVNIARIIWRHEGNINTCADVTWPAITGSGRSVSVNGWMCWKSTHSIETGKVKARYSHWVIYFKFGNLLGSHRYNNWLWCFSVFLDTLIHQRNMLAFL